ncbi:hypothetical protein HYU40_04345 [Candidatus Woesearchaeota archaeon]|nr:hypothetical protein [Candidatus Woesearchaeota archaeon]
MNILEKAKLEDCFRCADGSVISSVYELENKLCAISSEAFYHHVNPVRNDFHNWIKDVFQDYELANELLGARTPAQAAAIIRKHLRKALLAKEEIENAIKTALTAKTKPIKAAVKAKPARTAAKKLPLKPKPRQPRTQKRKKARRKSKAAARKKTTAGKNRKLNKKRSTRKSSAHNRAKKKVNRWLNWLKIVPEL